MRLLLERALRLHGEFGGHDCCVVGSQSRGVSRCVLRARRLFNFQRVRLVCASGDVGQRAERPVCFDWLKAVVLCESGMASAKGLTEAG